MENKFPHQKTIFYGVVMGKIGKTIVIFIFVLGSFFFLIEVVNKSFGKEKISLKATQMWLKNKAGQDYSITELKNLETLASLYYIGVKDISPLKNLKKLKWLRLHNTGVTDLRPLKNLKKLDMLNLKDTQVKKKDIEELKKALPNCEIIY